MGAAAGGAEIDGVGGCCVGGTEGASAFWADGESEAEGEAAWARWLVVWWWLNCCGLLHCWRG